MGITRKENIIRYYNDNAQEFVDKTVGVEFTGVQEQFLLYLHEGARILDFGCGAGRDTKYFIDKGYKVDAIDGSKELCKLATRYTGMPVKQMYFEDLNVKSKYDSIC